MAQDGSINLPNTCTASPAGCEMSQDQQTKTDTLRMTIFPQSNIDHNDQQPINLSQLKPGCTASDDNDVQFVFAAPRRRKRKRKRLDFSYSPSTLDQCSILPTDSPLKQFGMTPLDPARRRSLGVLEQLESCHIAARESKDHVIRSGSLPIAPSTIGSVPNAQTSSLPGPNCASIPQSLSHSSPNPWWNESRPLVLTTPVNFPDWRPLYPNDSVSKKRKLDSELAAAETQRLIRQSSQISPRTTAVSTLPLSEGYTRDLAMDTSDMFWTSSLPSISESPPSDPQMITSWSNFDWNAFDKLGTVQCGSQPFHQAMPINVTIPEKQMTNFLHQPRLVPSGPRYLLQQNDPRVSSPQILHPSTLETAQNFRPFQNCHHQVRPQQTMLHGSATPMNLCIPHSQQLAAMSKHYSDTSRTSANLPSHPRANQRKRTVTSPSPSQVKPPHMHTESADLLRKPSLYAIPAWPTARARSSQILVASSPPQFYSSGSNPARNAGFQSHVNFNAPRQSSNLIQPEKLPIGYSDNGVRTEPTKVSSDTNLGDKAAEADTFELPRARASRKYCPNLIVDIAETCQELFPFAEVAERHSVPIKKVFDTFSAIIQLPLLRSADDRRRHGSLGKRRMKEYRDARKAMEKAQEAERKAQMKAMKARVEEAGKKGKGQANAAGLLKAAILNNATQSQLSPSS